MSLNIEKISQVVQQKILAAQTGEELQKIKKGCLGKGGTISQIFNQIINLNNNEEKKQRIRLINE